MSEHPTSIQRVTASWLSQLLGRQVREFTNQRIGEGHGFLGTLYSLHEEEGPMNVILKFGPQHDNPDIREFLDQVRPHHRECAVYNAVAPLLPSHVLPNCLLAVCGRGHDGVIAMEDLSRTATVPSFLRGLGEGQARNTLTALSVVHAVTSKRAELDPVLDQPVVASSELFLGALDWFLKNCTPELPTPKVDFLRELHTLVLTTRVEQEDRFKRVAGTLPVAHGDLWASNILLSRTTGTDVVALVDWQFASRTAPMLDVAMLLASSLDADLRRGCARELVRAYTEALVQHGGFVYSQEEAFADFSRGMCHALEIIIISAETWSSQDSEAKLLSARWSALVDDVFEVFHPHPQ
mmetsp:Transcript_42507/g.92411  ORF Transcript_42507/g.92411 Transcript_42507/m.92411 type:complete len:352 (-) Transcript_42507:25-1080(-)